MSVIRLLKRHLKRNRSIMIIFILCQICSVIAYCFAFLYINSIQTANQGDITVSIAVDGSENTDEFVKKTEQLRTDFSESIKHISFASNHHENSLKINYYYQNVNDLYLKAGFYFQSNDTPQCIVSAYGQDTDKPLRVGDHVEIFGVSHEVVALSSREEWEINAAAIEFVPTLTDLTVVIDRSISRKTENTILSKIENMFPNADIQIKSDNLSFWDCVSGLEMLMLVLILLIVNINFIGLFLYIMKEDKRMISTLRLLGCTVTRAVWISFQEIFCLCTLSFASGILLFQTVIGRLISMLNSEFIPYLPLYSVAIIYLLYAVSITLIFLPLIQYQYRKQIFISGRRKKAR